LLFLLGKVNLIALLGKDAVAGLVRQTAIHARRAVDDCGQRGLAAARALDVSQHRRVLAPAKAAPHCCRLRTPVFSTARGHAMAGWLSRRSRLVVPSASAAVYNDQKQNKKM